MSWTNVASISIGEKGDYAISLDTALDKFRYEYTGHRKAYLGSGAYSFVYKATQIGQESPLIALKKSRVSKKIKRTLLRQESRILQLLKGHHAIPAVFGYGQLDHFEYLSMELLGPSIAEKFKNLNGAAFQIVTVIRIVDQVLAALEHIHSFGIVHRDIKPDNILLSLEDEPIIKVIDFDISKPFSDGPPTQYDPIKEQRSIMGTIYWASLNSHNGIDLSPRDDIESLAYMALFLLRGTLPWKPRPRFEFELRSQEIVRILKSRYSGETLSQGFPKEFGELLDYSRSLGFNQFPDHAKMRGLFLPLATFELSTAFDWTPCYPETTKLQPEELEEEVGLPCADDEGGSVGDGYKLDKNSYHALDISMWDNRQGERDKDITLPSAQGVQLENCIAEIVQVIDNE